MLNALVIASLFATAQAGPVCTGTELSATAVGSGTASDPWQICTVEQLLHVSSEPDGNFLLVDDLDLMGINWPAEPWRHLDPPPPPEGWLPRRRTLVDRSRSAPSPPQREGLR